VIVVDTNVIAALVLPAESSNLAERLFLHQSEWAAPLLWRSELRNMMATQMRADRLDLDAALSMTERAEEVLAGREFAVDSATVLRLAAESGCTAYDCEFVALAGYLAAPFVTLDRQLLAAFPATAVNLRKIVTGRS